MRPAPPPAPRSGERDLYGIQQRFRRSPSAHDRAFIRLGVPVHDALYGCLGCDATFPRPVRRGRPRQWCSTACSTRFERHGTRYVGDYRDRAEAKVKCAGCSRLIVPAVKGNSRRWCSESCRGACLRRGVPLTVPHEPPVLVVARDDGECAGCPAPASRGRVYCSEACGRAFKGSRLRRAKPHPGGAHVRHCTYCGRAFTARAVTSRYCGRACKNRATVNGRRRRLAAVDARPYSKVAIFERDGWVCQLCDEPINRMALWPADDSATVDHIVPVSRGGADAAENLQAAHWGCNRAKGTSDNLPCSAGLTVPLRDKEEDHAWPRPEVKPCPPEQA